MPTIPMTRLLLLPSLIAACTEYKVEGVDEGNSGGDPETGAAVLVVDPLSIDFGTVVIGDEATAIVDVSNAGDADLQIGDMLVEGDTGAFQVTALGSPTLRAGEATTFAVVYTPLYTDSFAGTVNISSDAAVDGAATVTLVGDTPRPSLRLDPIAHDFGTLEVGLADAVELTVWNDGEGDGAIQSLDWTTSSAGELYVADAGALSAGTLTLAPGDSATLTVAFAPGDDGAEEATLRLTTDDLENPELSASIEGRGEAPAPTVYSYVVEMELTADDMWEAAIDGVAFTSANALGWSATDTVSWTLDSGDHVIAVYADDTAASISGFLSAVRIDGVSTYLTGDGSWVHVSSDPGTGWQALTYDDSSWTTPVACADASTWGTTMSALYSEGAQWVWWTSECRNLGSAWFRLEFTLP